MSHGLVQTRVDTARGRAAPRSPISEGPVTKDLLLRSVCDESVGMMKCRAVALEVQGGNAPEAAIRAHLCGPREPEQEAKAVSMELLILKFDITREALGTGDPFVMAKSGGDTSFFAIHGLMLQGEEGCGAGTLALRMPERLLGQMAERLMEDPNFANELLHSVFEGAAARGLTFSIKTRVDILFDRKSMQVPLERGAGPELQG
ncbi:MAG: hypothetical protein AB1529_01215 [Candidatus Micrarchaeota archaeon]